MPSVSSQGSQMSLSLSLASLIRATQAMEELGLTGQG
jgi:hypothetical protein